MGEASYPILLGIQMGERNSEFPSLALHRLRASEADSVALTAVSFRQTMSTADDSQRPATERETMWTA
jgi:hypothetical protein